MKYDPKALEAMIDSFNFGASPEQILDVYCEKAGVVMVPVDTVKIIGNHWAGEYFKGVSSNDAEDIDRRISEMIRASQEEE
ncbi:hypothetical protein B0E33_01500 [Roseibium algicola]|uniref:Uncharacterized protein n=1 Tax=Roseibium algicola TaxID=2857014 RepID=A0ABM6HWM6_9HYPH|nr:hypothetical protein [Roseibium aggregatum]AQQ02430.1 hypothetical protein B0E33_01500 [Roseibium aggregatum]